MRHKFWEFEKESVLNYMSKRPKYDILDYLTEKEHETVEKDAKYGTIEYLDDSILFRPDVENACSLEINIFIGDSSPKKIVR